MSKRILNVMLGRGLGGIEQASLDYAEALRLAGYEVHMVLHPDSPLQDAFHALGIAVHALPNWGEWDIFAIQQLKKLVAGIGPDAAIAHGNRATTLLARAGVHPLLTVTHNYKIRCAQADAVFCPTQDLITYAISHAAKRTFLVPNMVRVKPLAPRVQRSIPVIGTMGRLVAKKGMDLFIEALALLASQGKPFQAVLAGDGEEKSALEARAKAHGLDDTPTFCGWVEDKDKFFASLDIFCLPSHHEPFGIVLLEAMAHGLPVVATMSEGPSEILANGGGVLVEKGDAAALAAALAKLLDNVDLRAQHGYKAYEVVKETYDLPVVSCRLDEVLKSILNNAAGTAR